MSRRVIIFSCLLWVLTEAGAPCGLRIDMNCVPQGLCRNGAFFHSACQRSETCCHPSAVLPIGAPLMCGRSNPHGLEPGTLVAADQAQPNEFPWVVALMKPKNLFFGAGTLVTENVVVTAAHLMLNRSISDFIVVGGAWDLNELFKNSVVTRSPARVIPHPGFVMLTGANNIALIILAVSFYFKPQISPICWASPGTSFVGERCLVVGWGKLNPLAGNISNRQKKIDLPIVSRRMCEIQLKRTLGPSYELDPTMLCAGGERGRDACKGDGGSPLMCPIPGYPSLYEFVGIVNSGVSCGEEEVPGLYTSITQVKSWIDQQLDDELNKPYKTFPIYNIDYDSY
ncbi:phenoloxidase-activating factor 2 [Drosophila elegans]|uniref:phenoloxidase-activating factor 2 n=1 Tax=Drosophila elegans TaxID=30023 RepID=UPI0007E6B4A9|nr:phenoloxidase-activating factor 2 [Drosophila elegans]